MKDVELGMIKNGLGHSGYSTLNLAVSQEGISVINWLFAWWYKFIKAKSYFDKSGVDKSGCDHSGHTENIDYFHS